MGATEKTRRLFLAVDPSAENNLQFEGTIERLRKIAPRARWVRAEKLHVTLVFLGEIQESQLPLVLQAQHAAAKEHSTFTLQFAGGGTFGSNRRARVLWAGVGGDLQTFVALQKNLAEQLEKSIGYQPEHRAYTPHLTLARSGEPRGDENLLVCAEGLAGQSFGETIIAEIVLYQSETTSAGARYTALERARLR